MVHTQNTRQCEHLHPYISRLNTSLQSIVHKGSARWDLLSEALKKTTEKVSCLKLDQP